MRCFGHKNSLGLRSAISVSQPWKGKRTPSWCLSLVVVLKATFCSRLSNPTYYSLTHYPHKPTILTAPLLLALPSPLPLLLSDPVRCFVSVWLPLEISISDDFFLFFSPFPALAYSIQFSIFTEIALLVQNALRGLCTHHR